MSNFNFNNVTFNSNNIIIADSSFSWKFHNVVTNKKTTERHYKCSITGCFMCKEFKAGGGLKSITYSLPDSEDYNINSLPELISKLKNQ
jgi:hypothetical protein